MENEYYSSSEIFKFTENLLNSIPFNNHIGTHIDSFSPEKAIISFKIADHLIGNPVRKTLHGGVISAVLDSVGGLTILSNLIKLKLDHYKGSPQEMIQDIFSQLGTIDLRVDYLRPGQGELFFSQGKILRLGNKVGVTKMDLVNEKSELLAVATGTYIVG